MKREGANTMKTTHSKVMTIANKLVNQGQNRANAMVKAWALVKMQIIEIKATGVTYGKRQKALEHLRRYNNANITLDLHREKDNTHDSNAIAVIATVKSKGSYCIGYVPRILATFLAPLIDSGKSIQSIFKEVRGGYEPYMNYGIAMQIIV